MCLKPSCMTNTRSPEPTLFSRWNDGRSIWRLRQGNQQNLWIHYSDARLIVSQTKKIHRFPTAGVILFVKLFDLILNVCQVYTFEQKAFSGTLTGVIFSGAQTRNAPWRSICWTCQPDPALPTPWARSMPPKPVNVIQSLTLYRQGFGCVGVAGNRRRSSSSRSSLSA